MIADERAWTVPDLPVLEVSWRPATEPAAAVGVPRIVDRVALAGGSRRWHAVAAAIDPSRRTSGAVLIGATCRSDSWN